MAEKESKKRKRQSNGVQTPSKKVAFENEAQPSKVIKVEFVQDGSNPVIVSTSGLIAPLIPFKAYSRVQTPDSVDSAVKPSSHELLLQSSRHPRLDFSASTLLDDHGLSHYVAVFDPSSSQLQITPAHRLGMSSKMRAEEEQMTQRGNITQQRVALGLEFGTKKARKVLAGRTWNAISTDIKGKSKAAESQTAILDSVGETTSRMVGKDEKSNAELLFASKPIPRPNLEADTVEGVYTFGTLVPASESKQLQTKEWQDKMRTGEEISFSHLFPSTWMRLNRGTDDVLKLKALGYMALLLEFQGALTKAGPVSKKVPKKEFLAKRLSSWPQQLVDMVRRRFSNESGSELTKWHLDNLYTHICALALFVNGWVTDTTDLSDDLRLDARQISQYFSELGCKVAPPTAAEQTARGLSKAKAANTRIARLRIPLEFPKPRKGRK